VASRRISLLLTRNSDSETQLAACTYYAWAPSWGIDWPIRMSRDLTVALEITSRYGSRAGIEVANGRNSPGGPTWAGCSCPQALGLIAFFRLSPLWGLGSRSITPIAYAGCHSIGWGASASRNKQVSSMPRDHDFLAGAQLAGRTQSFRTRSCFCSLNCRQSCAR